MTGHEFYNFLYRNLKPCQKLGNNFTFSKWLQKKDKTYSLQFAIPNNPPKSIPQEIIILAKNEYNKNKHIKINEKWFKDNGCNRGWCAPIVMSWLLAMYQ